MKYLNKLVENLLFPEFSRGANLGQINGLALRQAPRGCPVEMSNHTDKVLRSYKENHNPGDPIPEELVNQVNKEIATLKILVWAEENVAVKCFGELPDGKRCNLMDICPLAKEMGTVVFFPRKYRY